MGKNTVRLFCSLGIFIFSLCFTKVLNAPPSIPSSIIDAMQGDEQLCPMPDYVLENDIIKECRNAIYPEPDVASDSKLRDAVLCKIFYDTWYKYCQRDQSQVLFNSTASFHSYIQKFSPEKSGAVAFCDNIKSIKFSYDKLKPSLTHANFDKPNVCFPVCFEVTGNFVPLCGILAWSKSLDDEAEQAYKNAEPDKAKASENTPAHEQVQESSVPADKNSKEEAQGIHDDNTNENVKADGVSADAAVANSEKGKAKPVSDADKKVKSSIEKPESKTVVIEKLAKNNKAATSNEQVPNNEKEETAETLPKSETKTEAQDKGEGTNSHVNTGTKVIESDDIEGSKKEIISPNTDDHDNSNIQDDWNHLEDDKLQNDPNDDQPGLSDPVDQSQGVPEPSEQRDIISRYSIRTDEDSHFFTYFTIVSLVSIAAYVGYHNKQKILAIVLEGRRSRNSRGRRRPSTANYRKLDCTLEEAVTSQCEANVTHVIY